SKQDIEHLKESKDRMVTKLKPPIPVDITYDTEVVESGVLHVYPDIYDRGTNSVENIREELESNGVDTSGLKDQTINGMMQRVKMTEEYFVKVSDIQGGNLETSGQNRPLTIDSKNIKPAGKRVKTGPRSHQSRVHKRGV